MCQLMLFRGFWGRRGVLLLLSWSLCVSRLARADMTSFSTRVRAEREDGVSKERAHSTVSRADIERRQARSAPEALHYETGVFVQQTAHGQGSAFIRGLTGQQTMILFDGIRLNNSTYRQGPNQYFFTIDARVVDSIEILRGGGSTRYGSDALGGVIASYPIEPLVSETEWVVKPQLSLRATSADDEMGGRAQLQFSGPLSGGNVRFIGGGGYRHVGMLKSGGRVENPNQNTPYGRYPLVPAYAKDGVTQLGTGFQEATADGRLVFAFGKVQTLTLATYHYLQFDVPRTDQCPPPTAPKDTCLTYEEQFRHLTYLTYEGKVAEWMYPLRITISVQMQHEKQRMDDPSVLVVRRGIDDVVTLGFLGVARTKPFVFRNDVALSIQYGFDQYIDWLTSTATRTFTDTQQTANRSRGQYLSGSSYVYGGMYVDATLKLPKHVSIHAGGRWSWIAAQAPADLLTGSLAVKQTYFPWVGRLGTEWRALRFLTLHANVDHSFRAPNLNDLTARQQTGPGFQFENAELRPERATTFELGSVIEHAGFSAQIWGYETLLQDAVLKVNRTQDECPKETPQCEGSWSRLQLQNAPSYSEIRGVETTLKYRSELGLSARATFAYTWGETPAVGNVGYGAQGLLFSDRVPMTRIPPLQGTVEGIFQRASLDVSVGLRWAAPQNRLALSDYADARIPKYGTPGFVVADVRTSVRIHDRVVLGGVLENITNAAYRYHGSSVNGAGRSFVFSLRID